MHLPEADRMAADREKYIKRVDEDLSEEGIVGEHPGPGVDFVAVSDDDPGIHEKIKNGYLEIVQQLESRAPYRQIIVRRVLPMLAGVAAGVVVGAAAEIVIKEVVKEVVKRRRQTPGQSATKRKEDSLQTPD